MRSGHDGGRTRRMDARDEGAAAASNMDQRTPEPEPAASTQITDEDIPF